MNKPQCKTCAYFEKNTCLRYPDAVQKAETDGCGEHDMFKPWYLKTHQNTNQVDTSSVKTKAELGEKASLPAAAPAIGGEVCAECDGVIVDGKCKCGHGF